VYGQTLNDVDLTAFGSAHTPPGTFTWDNTSSPVGNFGSNSFTMNFTPDGSNYDTASESVAVDVSKATPSVNWPTGLTAVYGQTLNDVDLTSFGSAHNPPGTFTWDNTSSPVGNFGSNSFTMNFTPDGSNYDNASESVAVDVSKADQDLTAAYITRVVADAGTPIDLSGHVTSSAGAENNSGEITFAVTTAGAGASITPGSPPQLNFTSIGTAIITATAEGSDNFNPASTTFELRVTAAQTYEITILINPVAALDTNPPGTLVPPQLIEYPDGATVELPDATPRTGFRFVDWIISSGTITGTIQNPTSATTANFVMGSTAVTVTANFAPNDLTFNARTLTAGTFGAAYNAPMTTPATGGSGSYEYTATNLPSGLTMSLAGVISGTPDEVVTNATFTVTVTDTITGATEDAEYTITINKATVIPSINFADATNKEYDGNTSINGTPTITLTRVGAGLAVTSTASATIVFADANVGTNKLASATGITLDGTYGDNYVLSTTSITQASGLDITQRPLSWNAAGTVNNKVYNGTTAATVLTDPTLSGVLAGDASSVSVRRGTVTFASANAANGITVNVSGFGIEGAAAGNYTAPTGQPTFSAANITQATTTGTPRDVTFAQGVADSQSFDLTTLVQSGLTWGTPGRTFTVGTIASNTILTAPNSGATVTSPMTISVNNSATAGDTVIIPINVRSGNYADFTVNITVIITDRIPVTITGITTPGKVFDGQPYAPTGTVSAGTANASTFVWLYTSTDGGTYSSATPPTNAGKYKLTISLPTTDQTYVADPLELDFEITPRPITLVADSHILAVHDEGVPELTFIITNLATGHDASDALSDMPELEVPTFNPLLTGDYPIVITGGTETANYIITDRVNGVLTVSLPTFIFVPEPITDITDGAEFTIRSVFVHLYSTSLNGNTLTHTVSDDGTRILLSGYPGYDGYIGHAESGSTIIIFYEDFLAFLPNGSHTLEVSFHNGIIEYATPTTSFILNRTTDGGGGGSGGGGNIINPTPDDTTSTRSPQTGDSSNTPLWQSLLLVSVFGIITAVIWNVRREIKYRWELKLSEAKSKR
jgi:hypothetical protein